MQPQKMDKQSGTSKSSKNPIISGPTALGQGSGWNAHNNKPTASPGYGDSGGASRFFPVFKYQAKAPKKERPVVELEDGTKVQHPTVKPLALMEWLVALITPPGGTILDPFAGTGTTLQAAQNNGFSCVGIERDQDYVQLIHKRLLN